MNSNGRGPRISAIYVKNEIRDRIAYPPPQYTPVPPNTEVWRRDDESDIPGGRYLNVFLSPLVFLPPPVGSFPTPAVSVAADEMRI